MMRFSAGALALAVVARANHCNLAYDSKGVAPFSDEDVATLRKYFLANIDIQGSGAVVAAPDHNTGPGGDYYFHWERDGALSMNALMQTADSVADVSEQFTHYVTWVEKVQNQQDPHGIDVRTEPKYTIPDGKPFEGSWCRPQNDGPGLRARTLALYGLELLKKGQQDVVKQSLWTADGSKNGGLVRHDLDWVVDNWQSNGCDLWEEVQSNDFFWNRYTMRASLEAGAQLAEKMGDADAAKKYRSVKGDIEKTLGAHYNGQFVFEAQNRQKDSAVVEAFNVGDLDDGFFAPLSAEVLNTVIVFNDLFCNAYNINGADSDAKVPGILYGRYEGDNYDGGNPWVLLSADVAILLYRQAAAVRKGATVDSQTYDLLKKAYGVADGLQGAALADALVGSGDGVMLRIKRHLNGLHANEQIDRETGKMTSAKDLTWNYSNLLKAVKYRAAATVAPASESEAIIV